MSRYDPKEKVEDEEIIKVVDSWQFSVSKSQQRLYIDTTDHHPIKLKLSRDDLQGLLDTLDKLTE